MSSTELVSSVELVPPDDNAYQSLLNHIVEHERTGSVIPLDLLQFGIYGSIMVISIGLLALILPSAGAIRHGGFFLVLGGTTASIDSLMGEAAPFAIIGGIVLLGVDVVLLLVRSSARWRLIVVAQAAAGGAGGILCAVFLALVILNLAAWIFIGISIVAAVLIILGVIGAAIAGS